MYILRVFFLFFLGISTNCIAQHSKENLTKSNKMKVEIWSDIVCPFCYIGKRHFEAALKSFENTADIEIVWKSYQLDPEMPKQPIKQNVYEYLASRKGISVDQSKAMHDNVVNMASNAGLNYNFDKAVVANSFDAHRLIQLAKTLNLGDQAEELLFKAYFIEGKDIADHTILMNLGKEIGIDEEKLKTMLQSDEFSNRVETDIYEAAQVGVSGVPFFVIDNRFAISGAQPVSVFLQTLQKAYLSKK
jgi:predicted DsbA family dithiol-disulfide isomerase